MNLKRVPLSHWIPVYGLHLDSSSQEKEEPAYLGSLHNRRASKTQEILQVPYLIYQAACSYLFVVGVIEGARLGLESLFK